MPKCKITKDQLKEVMKYDLKRLNLTSQDITDDTKHGDILSDDGSTTSSKRIYKSLVRYTIRINSCEDKNWPANWMDMTVAELADKLI